MIKKNVMELNSGDVISYWTDPYADEFNAHETESSYFMLIHVGPVNVTDFKMLNRNATVISVENMEDDGNLRGAIRKKFGFDTKDIVGIRTVEFGLQYAFSDDNIDVLE